MSGKRITQVFTQILILKISYMWLQTLLLDKKRDGVLFILSVIQSAMRLFSISSGPARFLIIACHRLWQCPVNNKSERIEFYK